jgi:protein-disulfide isomerase
VRRRTLLMILTGVLALTLTGVVVVLTRDPSPKSGTADGVSIGKAYRMTITDEQPIVLGSPDARATVSIFTDFHCRECAQFHERFRDTLLTAERSGRARIQIYPVSAVDPGSNAAANGLACAAEAGGAESYYLGLFANPELRWTDSQLVELGNNSSLLLGSEEDFETCVTSQRHTQWVGSMNAVALGAGITDPPAVQFDGRPLDLASLTPEALSGMIEQANR